MENRMRFDAAYFTGGTVIRVARARPLRDRDDRSARTVAPEYVLERPVAQCSTWDAGKELAEVRLPPPSATALRGLDPSEYVVRPLWTD